MGTFNWGLSSAVMHFWMLHAQVFHFAAQEITPALDEVAHQGS